MKAVFDSCYKYMRSMTSYFWTTLDKKTSVSHAKLKKRTNGKKIHVWVLLKFSELDAKWV